MFKNFISITLLSLSLTACSMAPKYVSPEMDIPPAWTQTTQDVLEFQWWKRFNDPVLNDMINEALANNKNIEKAMANVDLARAKLGLARGDQFPIPSLSGDTTRARSSRYGLPAATPGHETNSIHQGNVGVSWELDLWGKYRNLTSSAQAQLLNNEAAKDGVILSIAGQTAMAYFNLLASDLQEQTSINTVSTREEALKIYTARYDQGLINELDLLRSKTELETARFTLYRTIYQREAAETALTVLLGGSPRAIMEGTLKRGLSLENMPTPPVFPAGLPSELLSRRPDIRSAEQNLRSANYEIGAAKAAFFPSISLTGLLGTASTDLDKLFTGGSKTWTSQGALNLPLNVWSIQAGVLGTEAMKRQAVADYELTVQTAFRELRDALSQQKQYANVVKSMELMVKELRKAVELAKTRYDNGYSAYLEVLDAERSLFNTEIDLATARNQHLAGIVMVCMALGGGWDQNLPKTDEQPK